MARPREFDERAVLAAAMQQFWRYGYEATSVRDLADSMGITGASLYNAFGDKRTLYRRALEQYLDQTFHERIGRFEKNLSPREALEAFFGEIVERSCNDKLRRGCMLVNSALEVAPDDPGFQRMVSKVLVQVEAFFFRCASVGQRDGTIGSSQPAKDIARLLLGVLLGIRVLARTRPDRSLLEGLIRPVFSLMGDKPAAMCRPGSRGRKRAVLRSS
jgi:TetR/AcrR family transcriptional regulator, transcriptional repressor for nem operon